MFSGRTALTLDAKGRLAVPTRQREKLNASCGGRVVLTQHPWDACLALYPEPQWEDIAHKVAELSDADVAVRHLKRRFLGQAVELELDGSGRILVPGELRELVGLDRKAMLVGILHRFEIWAEDAWAAEQASLADTGEMPESVKSLAF
ncbi:MAG: division/cell wall cluster transcriptional repressor MraZ [Alcanivoracaceae bacterium]|jgi:MraZ protein|nr:division/cell wall cluster transcriptional repressor MraZ [Alcanivoracaceae bacterium]